jgi:hypothetical protein
MSGKSQAKQKSQHRGHPEANLGQQEAALEKASKSQMRHMAGGRAAKSAKQVKAKVSRKAAS